MKFLLPFLSLLLSMNTLEAKQLSACHKKCFQKKYQCNIEKSYTYNVYNVCSDDLLACRASCESGKPQNSYATNILPVEIAFHPTLKQ